MTYQDAVIYASAMLILNAISTLLMNQIFYLGFHNGMKVRVAVCSIIYRKVMFFFSNINSNVHK